MRPGRRRGAAGPGAVGGGRRPGRAERRERRTAVLFPAGSATAHAGFASDHASALAPVLYSAVAAEPVAAETSAPTTRPCRFSMSTCPMCDSFASRPLPFRYSRASGSVLDSWVVVQQALAVVAERGRVEGLAEHVHVEELLEQLLYPSCSQKSRSLRTVYKAMSTEAFRSRSGATEGRPPAAYMPAKTGSSSASTSSTSRFTARSECVGGTRRSIETRASIEGCLGVVPRMRSDHPMNDGWPPPAAGFSADC